MRLKEELGKFEFVASMANAALFTDVTAGERVYLVVWVDDVLVTARGLEHIEKVKADLAEKFDVRELGDATFFVRMELTRDRGGAHPKAGAEKADEESVGR